MTEFITYASAYDMYAGHRNIGELPPQEQDELIRAVLGTADVYPNGAFIISEHHEILNILDRRFSLSFHNGRCDI